MLIEKKKGKQTNKKKIFLMHFTGSLINNVKDLFFSLSSFSSFKKKINEGKFIVDLLTRKTSQGTS
jgi:hypothetical protein